MEPPQVEVTEVPHLGPQPKATRLQGYKIGRKSKQGGDGPSNRLRPSAHAPKAKVAAPKKTVCIDLTTVRQSLVGQEQGPGDSFVSQASRPLAEASESPDQQVMELDLTAGLDSSFSSFSDGSVRDAPQKSRHASLSSSPLFLNPRCDSNFTGASVTGISSLADGAGHIDLLSFRDRNVSQRGSILKRGSVLDPSAAADADFAVAGSIPADAVTGPHFDSAICAYLFHYDTWVDGMCDGLGSPRDMATFLCFPLWGWRLFRTLQRSAPVEVPGCCDGCRKLSVRAAPWVALLVSTMFIIGWTLAIVLLVLFCIRKEYTQAVLSFSLLLSVVLVGSILWTYLYYSVALKFHIRQAQIDKVKFMLTTCCCLGCMNIRIGRHVDKAMGFRRVKGMLAQTVTQNAELHTRQAHQMVQLAERESGGGRGSKASKQSRASVTDAVVRSGCQGNSFDVLDDDNTMGIVQGLAFSEENTRRSRGSAKTSYIGSFRSMISGKKRSLAADVDPEMPTITVSSHV